MNTKSTFIWLTVFSVAMGYLESAVVIYIREIYYPGGFGFPLSLMSNVIATTEILREASTMVMLLTIGIIAGQNLRTRFAWFIYCFAIWDIFYYVFLKMMIGWPESLLTWDVLFLIPFMWSGPVIAPVITSFSMIVLAWLIVVHSEKILHNKPWLFAGLILSGGIVVFFSFILDFAFYVLKDHSFSGLFNYAVNQYAFTHYIPRHFPWFVFLLGEGLIFLAFILPLRKIVSRV